MVKLFAARDGNVLLNVSCYKVRERKKTLDTTVMQKYEPQA